jgi:hypothetical protein
MVASERGGEGVRGGVAGAAGYREMLQILTETIASGRGSRPNGDVEKVTGAPPGNFTDFARRTAAACPGDVAS